MSILRAGTVAGATVLATLVAGPVLAVPAHAGEDPIAPEAPRGAPPAQAPTAPPWTPHSNGRWSGHEPGAWSSGFTDRASKAAGEVADLPLDDVGDAIVTVRDERLLAPGLELTEFSRLTADGWQTGQVLVAHLGPLGELELGQVGVGYADADAVADTTTVTELAAEEGSVAAINGDYFDINNSGAPLGVGVDGGRLVKSPEAGRNRSVVVGSDGIGRLAQLFLTGSVSWSAESGAVSVPVAGFNVTSVAAGAIVVYDAQWGAFTRTRVLAAGERGVEVVVDADGVVQSVGRPGAGGLPDGVRAVVARPGPAADALATLRPGEPVDLAYGLRDDAGDVAVALGGGVEDWLLEDGEVTSGAGSHVEVRHPRTAVGFSEDGRTAYFVVVDGRQASSIGIDLYELGELMAQIGADDAINLDGGGSSEMVARFPGDGPTTIVNNPSDGFERQVPNGLALYVPEGSGVVDAYDVRTTVPAPDADRVFPGLHRTLVAKGYDEVMAPVDTPPARWLTGVASIARVDDGVVTGVRPGTTRVTARRAVHGGAATGGLHLEVLERLARIGVASPVVTLADADATAPLVLTGYDARGYSAPIEARDVLVTGGDGVAELVPAADGSFTVRAVAESGATTFRLSVGDLVTEVAVAVGLDRVVVADFADAARWTSAHDRAPGGSVGAAPGHDGAPGLRLTYDFTQSTATRGQYAVVPDGSRVIDGQPRTVSMWVNGDGNGAWLRLQVRQANGVTSQLDGPLVDWTGWRQAQFTVPAGVAFPLTLQRIRVLETRAAARYRGHVVVSDLRAHVPPNVRVPEPARVEDPVVVPDGATDDAPLRVAVMSDSQFVARNPDSPIVAAARRTLQEIVAADPDVLVINGDLVDEATPEDFDLARQILEEELGGVDFPWHYVPGNHEMMGGSIANFEAEFGERTRVVDVPAEDGVTRLVMLDSSTGRLGTDFAQVQMLREALDDAAAADEVTGVLVFSHHPIDDPLPTNASQLSDRLEANTLRGWYEDFRESTGKSIASVNAHVGVFHASTQDGVPYLVNGNSGKGPASTPADGGFTGWSLLGVDPAAGVWAPPGAGAHHGRPDRGDRWLEWEVEARTDAVDVSGPAALGVGESGDVSAVVRQDDTRVVPVAWPVSAAWGGDGVCVTDLDRAPGLADARSACDAADVLALDPAAGAVLALRAGAATVAVTVNGVTDVLPVTAS